MAKAYVSPSQGAQFVGMCKDLYESNKRAQLLFDKANEELSGPGQVLTGLIGRIQKSMEK